MRLPARVCVVLFLWVFLCRAAAGEEPPPRIDINSATAEQLMTVQGIGKKRAQDILDHRTSAGPFKRLAQLADVPGIGEKTLAKLACVFYVPAEGPLPCEVAAGPPGKSARKGGGKIQAGKVNLNTASVEGLCTLPGIGEKKAQQIVSHRKEEGWFESADDLREIKGFGEKTVERLAPLVETDVDVNRASEGELRTLGFSNSGEIVKFRDLVGGFQDLDDIEQVPGTDRKVLRSVRSILVFGPRKGQSPR